MTNVILKVVLLKMIYLDDENRIYHCITIIVMLLLSVVISATDLIQSVVWSVVFHVLTYLFHIPILICYYKFSMMFVEQTTFSYK